MNEHQSGGRQDNKRIHRGPISHVCAFFHEKNYMGKKTPHKKLFKCFSHGPKESRIQDCKNKMQQTYVCCYFCNPNQNTWRCAECYKEFQQKVRATNKNIHTMYQKELPSLLEFLLFDFDFIGIQLPSNCTIFDKKVKIFANGKQRLLTWRHGCCVHCFSHTFARHPKPTNAFKDESFIAAFRHPPSIDHTILKNVISVDVHGIECIRMLVSVLIFTVHPCISRTQSTKFLYRYADEEEHTDYFLVGDVSKYWDQFIPSKLRSKIDDYWVLVRSSPTPSKGSCVLSLRHIGALNDLVTMGHPAKLSQSILKVTRQAATPTKDIAFTNGAISVAESAYRSDRLAGPGGNASGLPMQYLREMAVSEQLKGSCPYTSSSAIVLPFKREPDSDIWTHANVYYIRVGDGIQEKNSQSKTLQVPTMERKSIFTLCRNNAVPSRAWHASGKSVLNILSKKSFLDQHIDQKSKKRSLFDDGKENMKDDMTNMKQSTKTLVFLKQLVVSTVSGAFLLKALKESRQDLNSSEESWCDLLSSYKNHCNDAKMIDCGTSPIDGYIINSIRAHSYSAVLNAVGGHQDKYHKNSSGLEFEAKATLIEGQPLQTISLKQYEKSGRVPPGALAFPEFRVATICPALEDVELHEISFQKIVHLCDRCPTIIENVHNNLLNNTDDLDENTKLMHTNSAIQEDNYLEALQYFSEIPTENEFHSVVHQIADVNPLTQNGRGAWYRNRRNGQWRFYPAGYAVTTYR